MIENQASTRGLRRRLLHGLGANALNPVVTAAIQLGSVPLLLHAWGVTKYGGWLVLSAIPSYLTLSDLGMGDASGSDMTMRVGAGDRAAALETFQSSWVLVTSVSFGILLLALLAAWSMPWQTWLKLTGVSNHQAALIISVLGAYVVLSQQNGILESGFRCDGHFAIGSFWLTMQRLTEVTAATAVALSGGSLVAVAFAYFIVASLGVAGYSLLLHRLSPWIHFGIQHARVQTIRRMAAPAFGFMAMPVGYALSFQGFTIAIGAVLGPIAVVSFSTLRTLSRLTVQLATVVKHGIWPELSRAFGAGDISLARRLHRHACQASLGLSLLGGSFLWLAGPSIYRLWIRRNVAFDASCFHVLLLVVVASCLWETSAAIAMSTNSHLRIALIYSAITMASVVLAWVLMPSLNTIGAGVALLLADLTMAVIVIRSALLTVQDSPGKFLAALATLPRFGRRISIVPKAAENLQGAR